MALASRLKKRDNRVYTLLGDGEIQEGQVWEACMFAAHYKLDNLCVIIDNNGLQIDGATRDVMNSEPLDHKMDAFGFNTIVCNGKILNIYNPLPKVRSDAMEAQPWEGLYWTTAVSRTQAAALHFWFEKLDTSAGIENSVPYARANGLQVRCVKQQGR